MTTLLPEGRLVYGMQLPIQSQSTIYAEPWEADATADDLRRIAQAADRAGFFYMAVCDHIAIPEDRAGSMGTAWWDTIATLAWLAGLTERVRLLSHVAVLAYRHPLQTAKAWSTLDQVSGGRAILGVGSGHVEGEFDLLGLDFADRGKLLDEAIDAVRAAFADEFPVAKGPQWPFEGCGQRPRPVQAGGPPMWVGGSSKPALRRAAERGDGWLPQGPVTPGGGRVHPFAPRRDPRRRSDRHRRHRRAGVRRRARLGHRPVPQRPAREAGPRAEEVLGARRRAGAGATAVALAWTSCSSRSSGSATRSGPRLSG